MGCGECLLGLNSYEIDFPQNSTQEEKTLILAAGLLMEIEFFETKKGNNQG